MSQAVYTPNVVLFDDRPKQGTVLQLNLSIYLDAKVTVVTNAKDLKKALGSPENLHLVIARARIKETPIIARIVEFLKGKNAKVPVICLGEEKELPGVTVVKDETQVKPMLQAAAKILGITAQQMVSKQRPETYEIWPDFLKLLFSFPCDVFDRNGTALEKVFSAGEAVPRKKVMAYVQKRRPLVIDSVQRLKLTNAVTEQSQKATTQLEGSGTTDKEKMSILSASIEMVSAQFQNSGMDEETVKLANASIKAVEKIAASATNVGNLVKQLMESEGGYRYAHCQLLTFLGFHVIKMMGWWGEEQRSIFSQAAFYHDISLSTDEDARISTLAELALKDTAKQELILTHAQLAARELQNAPEINPDVIRLVLQHHGSPVGKGFSDDISKLDNLAKTFVLGEKWTDYLIHLSDKNLEPDNEGKISELKERFKNDELAGQIIETFRYLDPAQFTSDFLEAPKLDLSLLNNAPVEEESAVLGGGESTAEPSATVIGRAEKEVAEVSEKVSGAATAAEAEAVTEVKANGATAEAKKKVKGEAATADAAEERIEGEAGEAEASTKVQGVTEHIGDTTETLVKGSAEAEAENKKVAGPSLAEKKAEIAKTIEAAKKLEVQKKIEATRRADDAKKAAIANKEAAASSQQEKDEKQKVESVTEHRTDEEVLVKEGAAEESSATIKEATLVHKDRETLVKGGASEKEIEHTIEEATLVHNDEEIRVKNAAEEEVTNTIESATLVHKDEEILVKGEKAAADKTQKKIEGATEHITEEKIVVKGDPQNYVDRSIARVKGDPEKERELKMKQLKGCTDLMKAALTGNLAGVTELLATASPTELRKTDAEGRSVIHYAGMGGAVDVLKLLAEKGVSLNGVDSKRRSALFLAVLHKQTLAFDFLMSQGAKINQQAMGGMTIAMLAAFSNNMHILKIAVEKGVRLDTRDHSGKTALDFAKQANAGDAIEYIQSKLAPKQEAAPAAAVGA